MDGMRYQLKKRNKLVTRALDETSGLLGPDLARIVVSYVYKDPYRISADVIDRSSMIWRSTFGRYMVKSQIGYLDIARCRHAAVQFSIKWGYGMKYDKHRLYIPMEQVWGFIMGTVGVRFGEGCNIECRDASLPFEPLDQSFVNEAQYTAALHDIRKQILMGCFLPR